MFKTVSFAALLAIPALVGLVHSTSSWRVLPYPGVEDLAPEAIARPLAQVQPDHKESIHYAPAENLERIDVALITATRSIDMAAYVLTDWPVIDALKQATGRGVRVRVYLDGAELSKDEAQAPFHELTGRRDAGQARRCVHAPEELRDRRQAASYRGRELFRIPPQAAR